MGFCRRCGDIVVGPRCRCGGSAVAPSVQFDKDRSPDRWSSTYVTRDQSPTRSPSKLRANNRQASQEASQTHRIFPRPLSSASDAHTVQRTRINENVSSHIRSTLAYRPTSPLKTVTHSDMIENCTTGDILPDPNTSTLAKAYGSVLQPKETLSIFTCVSCATPFPPDATIYPDPLMPDATDRLMCKACFTKNGGSKGDCAACGRAVLILAKEGGFVENSGNLWHKQCFRCNGCYKDVSDTLLVDLLGRPSCEECFDTCLNRPLKDVPRYLSKTPEKIGTRNSTSRDNSPALEDLRQRFGIKSPRSSPIGSPLHRGNGSPALTEFQRVERSSPKNLFSQPNVRSREGSPVVEELSARLARARGHTSTPDTQRSAERGGTNGGPGGIEAPSSRIGSPFSNGQNGHNSVKAQSPATSSPTTTPKRGILRKSMSNPLMSATPPRLGSLSPSTSLSPSISDLISDLSDTATQSSGPTTPSNDYTPSRPVSLSKRTPVTPTKTPIAHDRTVSAGLGLSGSPQSLCAECYKPLFKTKGGGRYVTIPADSPQRSSPQCYHVECFRCAICDGIFEAGAGGQAVFVRSSSGFCHVGCATPDRIIVKRIPTPTSLSGSTRGRPISMGPPPASLSFPRFGTTMVCPGCAKPVSPMERGVVPGPQGSRWHALCLVCGGKGADVVNREKDKPGCGKRLDSAAKSDGVGGVWCRDCLLLISKQSLRDGSPVRAPSVSGLSRTGSVHSRFPPSMTPDMRSTPLPTAGQLQGKGSDNNWFPPLSAGGLSPTRQLTISRSSSPTKQLSIRRTARVFPRPKSVAGIMFPVTDEESEMTFVRPTASSRVVRS